MFDRLKGTQALGIYPERTVLLGCPGGRVSEYPSDAIILATGVGAVINHQNAHAVSGGQIGRRSAMDVLLNFLFFSGIESVQPECFQGQVALARNDPLCDQFARNGQQGILCPATTSWLPMGFRSQCNAFLVAIEKKLERKT